MKPNKPHHYESIIENQNRSTSVKPGKLGKQIGDPEIKQFYREIRPGKSGFDLQKSRTTSEDKLSAKQKVNTVS